MDAAKATLRISSRVSIPFTEIELSPIRASGPGGQHVNKVSSALHLRFDINASSLPEFYKERLLARKDKRISGDGIIVIKAQCFRTREKNREDALTRLTELICSAAETPKRRIATRPTRASQRRRLDNKSRHGRQKALRGKVPSE